jgi:hypothetical protein
LRSFAKISPTFWTGKTGRQINLLPEPNRLAVRTIAMYLISSPAAHPTGLYQIPLSAIANDTGITIDVVKESLVVLRELDFAAFDEASIFVWVFGMAEFQLNLPLKENDHNRIWIAKWWVLLEDNPFIAAFNQKYKFALWLPARSQPEQSPLGGPLGASETLQRGKSPSPSPSPLLQSPSLSTSLSPFPSPEGGLGEEIPTNNTGWDGENKNSDEVMTATWKLVLDASEKWLGTRGWAYVASTKLVRIDARGLYVIWCPSKLHLDFMNQNADQLRKIARQVGLKVNRFVFQEARKPETREQEGAQV